MGFLSKDQSYDKFFDAAMHANIVNGQFLPIVVSNCSNPLLMSVKPYWMFSWGRESEGSMAG